MDAVREGTMFPLKSPRSGEILRTVDARQLWQRILETRLHTGEPYLLFIDAVNRALPKHQRELGLTVTSSNLCSEIVLPTGRDHRNRERTAVCCLSSLNLETWEQWHGEPGLIEDILRMLDNVLTSFITMAPDSMERARYSALRERSVGLGVMGFHSFLQAQGIPFESALAKSWNFKIFRKIRRDADAASVALGLERGPCPDAAERGMTARFSHKIAIAPTASISIICGGASACIEPIPANVYNHKTLSGAFVVRNPHLARLLAGKGADTPAVWQSIVEHEGSVQHLECLSASEKAVFRTAFEIDQRWIIDLAADRAPFICQSQSLNLYLPADIDKWDLGLLKKFSSRDGSRLDTVRVPFAQRLTIFQTRIAHDRRGGSQQGTKQRNDPCGEPLEVNCGCRQVSLDLHVGQAAPDGTREPMPGFGLAVNALHLPSVALIERIIAIRPVLAPAPCSQQGGVVIAKNHGLVRAPAAQA